MWATFTPTKMSGQVLKIYKKTLKVCLPFEGLIATLNEKVNQQQYRLVQIQMTKVFLFAFILLFLILAPHRFTLFCH